MRPRNFATRATNSVAVRWRAGSLLLLGSLSYELGSAAQWCHPNPCPFGDIVMKLIFLWICHVDIMSVMRSNAEILQKKKEPVCMHAFLPMTSALRFYCTRLLKVCVA